MLALTRCFDTLQGAESVLSTLAMAIGRSTLTDHRATLAVVRLDERHAQWYVAVRYNETDIAAFRFAYDLSRRFFRT